MRTGILVDLGKMEYERAMSFQEKLRDLRIAGALPDLLILVEHFPVLTVGRSGGNEHLRADSTTLHSKGIRIVEADRGGSITFHGPGQVVVYPILHQEVFDSDPIKYLRMLELSARGYFRI